MYTQTTNGIAVHVKTEYRGLYKADQAVYHAFAYHIRIENQGDHPVQLLRRHWFIYDSWRPLHEVDGEGVVGHTPLFEPGEVFHYSSACQLMGSAGAMKGWYTFQDLATKETFEVEIPRFQLTASYLDN